MTGSFGVIISKALLRFFWIRKFQMRSCFLIGYYAGIFPAVNY